MKTSPGDTCGGRTEQVGEVLREDVKTGAIHETLMGCRTRSRLDDAGI
jgi:hypothetical protein